MPVTRDPEGNPFPTPYNPVGALGGTFAPAYIPGNAESERAIMQRQANRGMQGLRNQGVQSIDELASQVQQPGANFARQSYDPQLLRALAQNLPYDVEARRNAIAESLVGLGPSHVAGIGPAYEAALRLIPGAWEYWVLGQRGMGAGVGTGTGTDLATTGR